MVAQGNSTASRDIQNYLHPYTNLVRHEQDGPLVITKGDGIRVIDEAGKEYIEGLAGLWCASLGFSEKRLAEAAYKQMLALPFYHSFASKTPSVTVDLAERLIAMAPKPLSKVTFANSGSEANDTAIKVAWYYNNARGRPEKKKIIARQRAYHGVTIAAASLTGLAYAQNGFDLPATERILRTDCPHYYHGAEPGESEADFVDRLGRNLEALIEREGADTIAAFIAEPVMGAGGVVVPPKGYFDRVQQILRKHDILFIADEVICGFGRTGSMFGCQTFDIAPDMMSVAKQLSAAYQPISALFVSDAIYQAVKEQSGVLGNFGHGYTYSGHPVPAAVALETLKIYEERNIVEQVRKVAPVFQAAMRAFADHPLVGEVRGVGLIGAIELVQDKATRTNFPAAKGVGAYLVARAQEHGLIVRAMMNDSVAFCPPLIITEDEIAEMFRRFALALDDTAAMVARTA